MRGLNLRVAQLVALVLALLLAPQPSKADTSLAQAPIAVTGASPSDTPQPMHLPLIASRGSSAQLDAVPKLKGIAYRNWWSEAYATPESDLSMQYLRDTGAEWVALVVIAYQQTATSTTITAGELTPGDADVAHAIRRAHGLGLKVMLKPQMMVVEPAGAPAASIGKGMASEEAWGAWFAEYTRHLSHYADIAQTEGVEMLCIGTELFSTSHRAPDWRALIAEVRTRYGGLLTYSAAHSAPGFTGEEVSIAFWDALDYIGVSGYYPLTDSSEPSARTLQRAWSRWADLLGRLSAQWQKPVLLTEIGYRNLDGTNRYPWDYAAPGAPDLAEQSQCYEAAFAALWTRPWFAGMFWWEWGTTPDQGDPGDTGYTPHGRPAQKVLQRYYARR